MSRPSLSYANVMSTIAVFLALGGGAWAMSGPPSASSAAATIDACVKKSGKKKGQLRIVSPSATCRKRERRLTWASGAGVPGATGPKGDPGPQGAKGDKGDPGASGSADTPLQILSKLLTVDGSGSGLDASLLDNHDSSYFLPTTGKAADANTLDGINSTGFAQLSASSSAQVGLPAIGAHSCLDYNNVALGNVDPGDVVIVREGDATNLPAGVLLMSGSVQSGNQVHLRFCNVLTSASAAASPITIRWYAFNP